LKELWNLELYEQLFGKFPEDLTILNVFDRLEILFSMNENCEREIGFCSSHFYKLDLTAISSMPFEIFSNIISKSSLRLQDEESLYELISSNNVKIHDIFHSLNMFDLNIYHQTQ
jgi:hypothetical protein